VSILFADISNFTTLCEKLPANRLVETIDKYFTAFDEIIAKHGLEKIKTIGDAYLAVGNMPTGNHAKVKNVVAAGLEILAYCRAERQKSPSNLQISVRVGIHTGHVVAGVVGSKKFQYDIWGDAVNIAARMEQTGCTDKLNVSRATYNLVKDDFDFEPRGQVEAKNKGRMEMYYVKP
jgi:class 3 adenylate cyclase